jgi:nucleoside-diphosphate-sugar epimerase
MFNALYKTPVVTARLFMVYGPGQNDYKKLIPYVTRSLLRDDVPRLMSGTREIDWIYVDDVIDAYLALAEAPGIEGCTIDVGSGKLTSVRDVVTKIVDILSPEVQPDFGSINDRPMERVRVADVQSALEITGWKPRTTLSEGLAKTVDWYRKYASD